MTRRRTVAVTAAVAVTALVFVGMTSQTWLGWWWERRSPMPLTPAQASVAQACEWPGVEGTLRVFDQDVVVDCDPDLVAAWLVRATATGGVIQWRAEREAARPSRPLWLLRMALLGHLEGKPPPSILSALLDSERVPARDRTWLMAEVLSGRWSGAWVDPVLHDRVAAARLVQGDGDALDAAALAILRDGVAPGRLATDASRATTEALSLWLAGEAPPPTACPGPSGRCGVETARAVRAALAAEGDPALGAAPPGAAPSALDAPTAIWRARYGEDSPHIGQAQGVILVTAEWVASQRSPAEALAVSVASPYAPYGVPEVLRGEAGDPAAVIGRRRGGPWATALAAVTVADLAGVPLTVSASDAAVRIVVGAREVVVGACGRTPDGPQLWREVSFDEVLAGAATEAAGAALLREEPQVARRLFALAEHAGGVAGRAAAMTTQPTAATGLGLVFSGLAPAGDEDTAALSALLGADGLACPLGL